MVREISYDPVHDAQVHFRIIMDAMARPGKIQSFPQLALDPPESLYVSSALIGFALLNRDVGFHSLGLTQEVHTYLHINTDAQELPLEKADFIFLDGNVQEQLEQLHYVKTGDIRYPEQSATLIIQVPRIHTQPFRDGQRLSLSGPGVPDERQLYVSGFQPALIQIFMMINDGYPLGVDAFVTDSHEHFIGIPRTARLKM